MRRVNRKCIICGKHYEYCSGCAGSDPVWKTIYCCEDCREISHILSDYHGGILKLSEAQKRLNQCNKDTLGKLDDINTQIVNEILGNKEVNNEVSQVVSKNIIENKLEINKMEKKSIETQNHNKPNYYDKKNKNKKKKVINRSLT